ncbi:MAG: hypothetical protein GX862_06395 [Leucobacter sp.]|nr:hypothetical protein [Leucobacter sp.]
MNQAATVRLLQQRITQMQPLRIGETGLPTPAELRPLLPGGALRAGAATAVQGSLLLALALLSEASATGAWCGAIGVPHLGFEAADRVGVRLDRFVVVPHPETHTLAVTGMLAEVLSVVLLHPPSNTSPGEVARLTARLREHGTALVVLGGWPGSDTSLHATASRWSGLGSGTGKLEGHELTVRSIDRRGQRRHTIRFNEGRLVPAGLTRLVLPHAAAT